MTTTTNGQPSTEMQLYQPRDMAMDLGYEELEKLGDRLVRTGFLPKHIGTGAQFTAIVLTGREMGIPTMRAIRTLKMVMGNVTEDAPAQLARFKADGGKASFKVTTAEKAVLHLIHPNGDEHTETFTADDAKRAGLLPGKPDSTWAKYPMAMLRNRAITGGLKSIGWNGAPGVYDVDEMDGVGTSTMATGASNPVIPERVRAGLTVVKEVKASAPVETPKTAAGANVTDAEFTDAAASTEKPPFDPVTGEEIPPAATKTPEQADQILTDLSSIGSTKSEAELMALMKDHVGPRYPKGHQDRDAILKAHGQMLAAHRKAAEQKNGAVP